MAPSDIGGGADRLGMLVAACGAGSSAPAIVADSGRPASAGQVAERALPVVPSQPPGVAIWAPWPAALHDARHSGSSTGDGPTSGTVRWRRNLEAAATSGPVIGPDGTMYAASSGGVLHALDAATGDDRWTFDGHRSGFEDLSTSPLVLPNGTVLWGGAGRTLYALSGAGALLWQAELPGQPTSPASADGRRVYVGDSSGALSAFDVSPDGHRLVWTVAVGKTSFGSAAADGAGRIYTYIPI